MEEITKAYMKSRPASKPASALTKFTRIFDDRGEELKEMGKLVNGNFEFVWVSQGEPWREHKDATLALSLSLNLMFAMKNPPPQPVASYITVENPDENLKQEAPISGNQLN